MERDVLKIHFNLIDTPYFYETEANRSECQSGLYSKVGYIAKWVI